MQVNLRIYSLIPIVLILGPVHTAHAQEPSGMAAFQKSVLDVYLDCAAAWCDFSFIRREIDFVNYVRDPESADVHVLLTSQSTGSGGRRYTAEFIGRLQFKGSSDHIEFATSAEDTADEQREKLVHHLKIGLVPFVAQTPVADQLEIHYRGETGGGRAQIRDDRWNSWVFDVGAGGWFSSESRHSSYVVSGSAAANRVTAQWKVRNRFAYRIDRDRYVLEDGRLTSTSEEVGYSGILVNSLTDHWSAGLFGSYDSDTEVNWKHSAAVAHNLFPYGESDRKELTFAYYLRGRAVSYREETIYGRTSDLLGEHALNVRLQLTQPWGTARFSVEGSHYFHDAGRYSLDFWGRVSVRVARGLSLRAQLSAERIRDQLYLPKGEASLEEILLRRRQLATNFDVSGSVGFSYTFGSIYNNVVNNRL